MPQAYKDLAKEVEMRAVMAASKEQERMEKEARRTGGGRTLISAPIHDPHPPGNDRSPHLRVRSTHQFPPDHTSRLANEAMKATV